MPRARSSFAPALVAATLAAPSLLVADVCNPALPYTMPDHDQLRTPIFSVIGLQNNGTQYCVPTCTMNILTYLTNHGYPNLSAGPGAGPWLGTPAIYNSFSTEIENLAGLMMTDPFGGTNGDNALAGVREWINFAGYTGDIVVTAVGTTPGNAPELGDIAFCLVARCPISLSVGWYGPHATVPGAIQRNGGHCVTAVRLPDFCSATQKLSIRDPGNSIGSDQFSQAPGTTETYTVQAQVITRAKSNGDIVYAGPLVRILNYGSMGMIDGYRAFFPAFGLFACNNPVNGSCVTQHMPNTIASTQPPTIPISFPPTATILDLDIAANNLGGWAVGYVGSANGGIWKTSLGQSDPQLQSFPAFTAFTPDRICTGREVSDLFAIHAPANVVLKLNTRTGAVTPLSVADAATAICFDHQRDELVVFSSAARRVTRLNPATGAPNSARTLPSAVTVGAEPRITISPKDSYVWLTSGTNTGYGLINDTATTLQVAATITASPAQPLRGVDADDRGHVFTSTGTQLLEFAEPVPAPPTGSPWIAVTGGKFAAVSTGPAFRIARNRSNLDRAIHDLPEETLNVLPTQFGTSVVDCPPDFNGSGTLEVDDIFSFLTAWFNGSGAADYDGMNGLQVNDIFAFLPAWFAGCA